MLLAFRVSNYRSIRDEQELSLVRSRRIKHVASVPAHDGWEEEVTPVAALYGSNASGKSNTLLALRYMSSAVVDSYAHWSPDKPISVRPFRLDAAHPNLPSRFEIEIVLEGSRIQYGFELTSERVQREWLYVYPKSRRQTWFERDANAESEWYFGKALAGRNRTVAELTRPNSLFLSAAATVGHESLAPIASWFRNFVRLADSSNLQSRKRFTLLELEKDPAVSAEMTRLLRFSDLGICDVVVRRPEMDDDERAKVLRLARTLAQELSSEHSSVPTEEDMAKVLDNQIIVELQHESSDGLPPVGLPFEAESTGTQSLVALAGPVLQALRNGVVLLVDEIDTSLHPRLVAELIRLFQSSETNPRHAQLIFSTHDTSLLGNLAGEVPVLDRDQIWFVEKGTDGATNIYPLTDFSPRRLENLERGYLQGRYGAVPYVRREELVAVPEREAE